MKHSLSVITKKLKSNLPDLRSGYNVKELGVFGSVARGKEKSVSDVDILVTFSQAPGFFKFVELEERLARILDRKVDLVTKSAIKSVVKDEILRGIVYV